MCSRPHSHSDQRDCGPQPLQCVHGGGAWLTLLAKFQRPCPTFQPLPSSLGIPSVGVCDPPLERLDSVLVKSMQIDRFLLISVRKRVLIWLNGCYRDQIPSEDIDGGHWRRNWGGGQGGWKGGELTLAHLLCRGLGAVTDLERRPCFFDAICHSHLRNTRFYEDTYCILKFEIHIAFTD